MVHCCGCLLCSFEPEGISLPRNMPASLRAGLHTCLQASMIQHAKAEARRCLAAGIPGKATGPSSHFSKDGPTSRLAEACSTGTARSSKHSGSRHAWRGSASKWGMASATRQIRQSECSCQLLLNFLLLLSSDCADAVTVSLACRSKYRQLATTSHSHRTGSRNTSSHFNQAGLSCLA